MNPILLAYLLAGSAGTPGTPPTGCAPIDGKFWGTLTASYVPPGCSAGHIQQGDVLGDERTFVAGQQTESTLDAASTCAVVQTDCSIIIDCTRTIPISGETLRMYYDLTYDGVTLAGTGSLTGTALGSCPYILFGYDAAK